MKKFGMLLIAAVCAVTVINAGSTAWAIKPFEVEWKKTYYKPDGTADEKKLAAAVDALGKDAGNVCHMGTSKKMRNDYGTALSKLLKKTDKEDAPKIQAALTTVAGEKNASGKTYGDLIKAGELPGAK